MQGPQRTVSLPLSQPNQARPHVIPSYTCPPVSLLSALKGRLGKKIRAASESVLHPNDTVVRPEKNKLNGGNRAKALGHGHIVLADFTFSRGNGEDNKGFSWGLVSGISM